jgi:gamma-glutamyltranspeptidase/glutathione hydrolase
LNWDQPYNSRRSPVCANNIVAASQPLAVQAGIDAMRRGGNAVDAALATAITLTVVEPNMNGLGSDAFAILWDGHEVVGINGSGRSPAAMTLERFSGATKMPNVGWDSVTVPGAVSTWVALSERYGQLDFAALFEPAIAYAREGFQVGPKTAHHWKLAERSYAGFEAFREHFLPAPAAGERVRRPDMDRTLMLIAQSRGEAFYRGELAQAIVETAAGAGGLLSAEDLATHQAQWVTPICQPYREIELHEIPPNGQGLAAQIALGILQHLEAPRLNTTLSVHRQIEAMKIAIHAAFTYFADPAAMRVSPEELLAPGSLAAAAERIGDKASDLPPVDLPVSHDTVYLTTADASGMMVSFIQSNYMGFGSGIVIPGTGISLQNRGYGFSLDPGHPNCVGPAKRPYHTIIPGFVTAKGAPRVSFGVMGGHMQHQGHVQMVNRLFDCEENPQAASDAPRWRVDEEFNVDLESGFPRAIADGLAKLGHVVRYDGEDSLFGGAQLIVKTDDGYIAGSDHRKEGYAGGF